MKTSSKRAMSRYHSKRSEQAIQQFCVNWFNNRYPKFRGLLCYNLNNSKNKVTGAINQSLGLVKGRSDLVFYYCSKAYMIELKTDRGRQTAEQKQWQSQIESFGFEYYIIRSEEDFMRLINRIIWEHSPLESKLNPDINKF
jgi:hypothetical protein